MPLDPFTWEAGDRSIVFPTVQGIAAYENQNGDCVIRQQAGPNEDEDVCIIVPRKKLRDLLFVLESMLPEPRLPEPRQPDPDQFARLRSFVESVPDYYLPAVNEVVAGYLSSACAGTEFAQRIAEIARTNSPAELSYFVGGSVVGCLELLSMDSVRAIADVIERDRGSDPALPITGHERLLISWLRGEVA